MKFKYNIDSRPLIMTKMLCSFQSA